MADLISVSDELVVGLVEKSLGTSIQTVVFDTDEQLFGAIEHLKSQKVGTASMISLERLSAFPQTSRNEGDGNG